MLLALLLACGGSGDKGSSNHSPAFTTTPPTKATAGVAYAYTPKASDPEGDSVSIYLEGKANPAGCIISPNGELTWTPSAAQAGTVCTFLIPELLTYPPGTEC